MNNLNANLVSSEKVVADKIKQSRLQGQPKIKACTKVEIGTAASPPRLSGKAQVSIDGGQNPPKVKTNASMGMGTASSPPRV